MKKAKILEISSYPPPHAGWGIRVSKIKAELLRLGHECVVLNIGQSRKIKSPEYEDVQNGWDYIRKVFHYCLQGYRVHMHMNGQSPKGFVLTLISQTISILFGRRCILTFHAGTNQTYFPRENSRICISLFFLIFLLSRKIICNDEAVKKRICEYGVKEEKVSPIPAFSIQYLDFKEMKLEPELEDFFQRHSPILTSYSLLRPTFHIDTTLRAMAILKEKYPQIGMIFVGSTQKAEDMDANTLFQLIDELNLDENIYWTGNLSHDTFLTVLKRSKIFVRTYVFDGICSSVLESLSLGTPVVGCENELRPKEVVIFKTGDEQDLAKKVEYVMENYAQAMSSISSPEVRNTLAEEVNLLIRG